MYADRKYYETEYLLGKSPAVPESVYPYWEKQAECVLNWRTFNRLVLDPGLITDEVKNCICELTELLYQADAVAQKAAEQGGGLLASYSNDGQSGSFDLSRSSFTEEGKAKKTREIVRKYLGHTGLLYRGVEP